MKALILAAATASACAGCTTVSLERHTLNQIHSAADFRATAALHCLAMVAADPGALPAYAMLVDGTVRFQDMANISSTTVWTRALNGFAMETFAPTLTRSPQEQWTLDPVADYTRLEAMRCACRWVLYGPGQTCDNCLSILADPRRDRSPGPHFGVADRLARLPAGWFHVGSLRDMPANACYQAHCGDTWVWVTPDGREGLAGFILVLHDIATINIDALATASPAVLVTLVRWQVRPPFQFQTADLPWLLSLGGYRSGKEPKTVVEQQAKAALAKKITTKLLGPAFVSENSLRQELDDVFPARRTDQGRWEQDKAKALMRASSTPVGFREDRVVKPEFVGVIEQRMQQAAGNPGGEVRISWEEWMAFTLPYHGARTNVKPEGGAPKPPTTVTPPSRTELPYGGYLLPPPGYMRSPPPPSGLLGPLDRNR